MPQPIVDPDFAKLIPPLTDEEHAGLEASLIEHGCIDPLVCWDRGDSAILLDGHNRLAICDGRGLEFETHLIELPDRDAAKVWIIRNQFARRNLTPYQRAELALQLEPLVAAKAKARQRESGGAVPQKSAKPPIDTRAEIAKAAGVSHDTIAKAKFLTEHADEDTKQKLRTGETSVNRAYTEAKREERREANAEVVADLAAGKIVLPEGKYHTIVVDPPWPMQKIEREARPRQMGFDYPTMTEEQLRDLPIPDLANDDAHLYLWSTHKFLPMALRLVEHWGFRYQCLMTWVKNVGFTPFSWMYSTEHVLFCRKGNLDLLVKGKRLDFAAKVRQHSRKPDEFYQLISLTSPPPRIDCFSREQHEGFEQHGNEVARF